MRGNCRDFLSAYGIGLLQASAGLFAPVQQVTARKISNFDLLLHFFIKNRIIKKYNTVVLPDSAAAAVEVRST